MSRQRILNSKEIKNINKELEDRFGVNLPKENVYLMNDKDRLYISTRMIEEIDVRNIRVNSYGIYIMTILGSNMRLSIEGSQILGPDATKNVIVLDDDDADLWMKGRDLGCSKGIHGIFIIRNEKGDFMGSGSAKEGKLLNYVPKERRINRRD